MELVLVRHALPISQIVDVGAADPPLSDIGLEQARRLARYLAHEHWDAFYVSPMCRARQTLEPLVERCPDVAVTVHDDLAERDREATWYVPIEELRRANDGRFEELLAEHRANPQREIEFRRRCAAAFDGIIAAHSHGRVVAVCHGGVINAFLASVLGVELGDRLGFFYPDYSSVHRVRAARDGRRSVFSMNERTHLHPLFASADAPLAARTD